MSFTIQPNTPANKPAFLRASCPYRKVSGYRIVFPKNCFNLAGIQLYINGHKFIPSPASPQGWLTGEGNEVSGDLNINLETDYIFAYGINLATDYPHTILIGLGVS